MAAGWVQPCSLPTMQLCAQPVDSTLPLHPPPAPADTSAQAASLAATLKLHRHLSAGSNGSGNGNGLTAAEAELFEDMDDIGLKPATVYHNLRWARGA